MGEWHDGPMFLYGGIYADGFLSFRTGSLAGRLRLGYERYWLAEHHNLPRFASPAPEVMIGHVAMETERNRIRAGGIMLPNHAPLKVAKTFRVLEVLHRADDFPEQFGESWPSRATARS